MEVKKTKDWGTFPKLREAKNPAEASEPGTVRREKGHFFELRLLTQNEISSNNEQLQDRKQQTAYGKWIIKQKQRYFHDDTYPPDKYENQFCYITHTDANKKFEKNKQNTISAAKTKTLTSILSNILLGLIIENNDRITTMLNIIEPTEQQIKNTPADRNTSSHPQQQSGGSQRPRRSSMPVGTVCYLLSSFDITCLTLHYPNQVFREQMQSSR